MKTKQNISTTYNIEGLANNILQTNTYFLNQVKKQVNSALTLRNWFIGFYIVEYEQSGKDRADYGKLIPAGNLCKHSSTAFLVFALADLLLFRWLQISVPNFVKLVYNL